MTSWTNKLATVAGAALAIAFGMVGEQLMAATAITPPGLMVTVDGETQSVEGIGVALRNTPEQAALGLEQAIDAIGSKNGGYAPTLEDVLSGYVPLDNVLFTVPGQTLNFRGGTKVEFQGDLIWYPDPTLSFATAITNNGGTSNFSFTFFQPIVPVGQPTLVRNSMSGSMTEGGPVTGTVTVRAVSPPPSVPVVPVDGDAITEMSVATLSTNGGLNLFSAGVDVGPSVPPLSDPGMYGAFIDGFQAGPANASNVNFMQLDVNFSLTGGGDKFTINGRYDIVPVPVPVPAAAWMGLSLFGAIGAAKVVRGRNRQAA